MEKRIFCIKNKSYLIDQTLDFQHSGIVWDAALCILKYLEKNFEKVLPTFKNKNIVELGTGTGVLGLCINDFKPSYVVLTDLKKLL